MDTFAEPPLPFGPPPSGPSDFTRVLMLVGDRWTLQILRELYRGVTRFEQFRERLGVSPNVLSDRLRTLVDVGLIERRAYSTRPLRYAYHLTVSGREFEAVMVSLRGWASRNFIARSARQAT